MSKILKTKPKSLIESVGKKLVLNEIIKEKCAEFNESLQGLEFSAFSHSISLQDYQQAALKNALIALRLYMGKVRQNHSDCTQIEAFEYNASELLSEYHSYQRRNSMSLIKANEINRASFWMATGSGKTIVMIKLVALLNELIKRGEIPKKPIMLLAPNDKILTQFKEQINAYNAFNKRAIILRELRDFERADGGMLFDEITLYIERSDLLDIGENVGKDSKAKRLNYKNFLTQSGWYILLDEAHRGDSKDSVRKTYFNALASGMKPNGENLGENDFSQGFIFNFSATFEDSLDLNTCAFNYNLEKFNKDGFGKNIAVLDSDLKAFKYSGGDENKKRKRIIESFVLFAAIKLSKEKLFKKFDEKFRANLNSTLNSADALSADSSKNLSGVNFDKKLLYHNPLIIAVSDKVNTQEAGVKLYFEAILQVLANKIDIKPIALNLKEKLQKASVYFSQGHLSEEFLELVESVDSRALRQSVFYADESSSVEACKIKGNDKELAFKSKNANKPFMLLNIGSTKEWEKHYLETLGVESGEDLGKSYFGNINESNSPINIMMGSKVFNEGWDSNRVNLISFINIGSKNAKKYVLQTIGRGVRIEPFANFRARFEKCELDYNAKEVLKPLCVGLETLFIMASDYNAVEGILQGIESFKTSSEIKGFKVRRDFSPLLVPTYKDGEKQNEIYKISKVDFKNLCEYIRGYDEDILLLCGRAKSVDLGFSTLNKIKDILKFDKKLEDLEPNALKNKGFEIQGNIEKLKVQNAFVSVDSFFHNKRKEFREFKDLDNEICHFEKFTSTLDEVVIDEINKKIKELVSSANAGQKSEAELMEEVKQGKISIEQYTQMIKLSGQKSCEVYNYTLDSSLSKHYYNPLIIDEKGGDGAKGSIIYAIKNPSEVEFLRDLQEYVANENNALNDYEWCFCRLVQNVDEIFVPYFDSTKGEMRKFYPDFIFWLKHRQNGAYKILFIDPKGLVFAQNAVDKKEGFERIFKGKNLSYEGQAVSVNLVYFNESGTEDERLKDCTKSDIKGVFELLVE